MWANNADGCLKETANEKSCLPWAHIGKKLLFLVPAEGISRKPSPFTKICENAVHRCLHSRTSTILVHFGEFPVISLPPIHCPLGPVWHAVSDQVSLSWLNLGDGSSVLLSYTTFSNKRCKMTKLSGKIPVFHEGEEDSVFGVAQCQQTGQRQMSYRCTKKMPPIQQTIGRWALHVSAVN